MPRKGKDWLQLGSGTGYVDRTRQPLQCLIFISPLLVYYQIGSVLNPWAVGDAAPTHVVAFVLMLKFFAIFGAAGNFMPLAAVVAILLAWHLARKDKWDFDPKLYAGMLAESIIWAIPVFVISLALIRESPAAAAATASNTNALPWQTEVLLSVGAGIYEELLFRLIAITVLSIILMDIFEMTLNAAMLWLIVISAALFAGYHYLGVGVTFSWPYTIFLFAFGLYCAGIYLFRGFGIVVGCHAVYDLIVVAYSHYYLSTAR